MFTEVETLLQRNADINSALGSKGSIHGGEPKNVWFIMVYTMEVPKNGWLIKIYFLDILIEMDDLGGYPQFAG